MKILYAPIKHAVFEFIEFPLNKIIYPLSCFLWLFKNVVLSLASLVNSNVQCATFHYNSLRSHLRIAFARITRYNVEEVIIMTKSTNLNIRIDPDIKDSAEALFASFGITLSDAVNMFLCQSLMTGGIPFDVKIPRYNAETEAAIQETALISSGELSAKSYRSAKALFEDLDA